MKISELEIGELYAIKPKIKKDLYITGDEEFTDLVLKFRDASPYFIYNRKELYKNSLYVYLGSKIVKIEKRIDKKKKMVYSYKPHYVLCLSTGEKIRVKSSSIQTYFIKPKK